LAHKLIFAGTPAFAATCLGAIARAGHEVVLVLTQPDRPAGRGQRMTTSAVGVAAGNLGLRIEKPVTLRNANTQQLLRDCQADAMVVVAYGKILQPSILGIPRYGCLNIHASLLPRWRGAAPIQRAIEAGDDETGVCVMQMDEGLDTGPVLLERRVKINGDDTSATLFERLALTGADAIVEALGKLGQMTATPQATAGVTYAQKIEKAEAHIDWSLSAVCIERKIRAFDPFPGCDFAWTTMRLKVWGATILADRSDVAPGMVLQADSDGVVVRCGDGALRLTTLQKPGGRRVAAAELIAGLGLGRGERFT